MGVRILTSLGHLAFLGPLAADSLANVLSETRLFDQRYFSDRIQAGGLLDWDYTVDPVGNPTAITGSIVGTSYSPTFTYVDSLYFLTQGNGPWGNRSWTYDKIGNRLTFARTSEPTQSYTYAGTGHNPKLAAISPAPGLGTGSWAYSYDPAGNQTSVLESDNEGAVQTTLYDIAADGRMNALRTDTGPSRTDFLYDGRGYLREGLLTVTGSSDNLRMTPVYSSEGTLMARTEVRQYTGSTIGPDGEDQVSAQMSNETTQLFYFAGRPVAQLTSGPELLYLTTDHLGTPVLATDSSGSPVWAGGVEPFGQTWTAGSDNPDPENSNARGPAVAPSLSQLSSEKVFLRYPGQWASDLFRVTGTQQETYYNLHRWYEAGVGRYTRADPLGFDGSPLNLYAYANSNPAIFSDLLGLASFKDFPADKRQEMEDAVERAKTRLEKEPCCAGAPGPRLLELLDRATFIYDPDLHDRNGALCGRVKNFLTKTIRIGDAAFDFAQCCLLESTLTHEVNHLRAPSRGSGEEAGRKLEKDCFNCPAGSAQ